MSYVNREDLYRYKEPKEKNMARLNEISELGMKEVGVATFGIEGVMSGLYIEMIWNLPDDKWEEYMDWVKGLINNKNKKNARR